MEMDFTNDDDATDAEYVPDKDDIQDDSESETKPSRSPTSGGRMSKTWNYFEFEVNSNAAACKFCKKEVLFKSVAELKSHIDEEHARIDGEGVADGSDGDKEKQLHTVKVGRRTYLSSMIWKYFDVHDSVAKVATCKTCGKHLLYHTLNNLKKHLKRFHAKLDPTFLSTDFKPSREETTELPRKKYNTKAGPRRERQNRSKVWKSFTIVDPDTKTAKCKLCFKKFAYTYLTNLKKHLIRKHAGDTVESSSDEDEPEGVEDEQNTPVWAYFQCLDKTLKIASCLVCKKRTEYADDSDLIRHMNRKHPYVDLDSIRNKPKKLMITGNGDIYEIDENVAKEEPESQSAQEDRDNESDDWNGHNEEIEALHASETYLDESIFDESQYTPVVKKRILHQNTKQTIQEDSLDIFGRYMVSLMKKLPKQKADELQVDFVRQIMEAQLSNHDNNRSKSQVTNNRYKLSVNNDETRVTSNSKRMISSDGAIHVITDNGSEQILVTTSVADEMTVRSESN